MSPSPSIFASALVALAGCGDAVDLQVFVVVPEVALTTPARALGPCDLAGITRLTLEITGAEAFVLAADGCDRLETYWGFFEAGRPGAGPLVLEALAPGFHQVRARLWDADGTLRGERERPFATEPGYLELVFERGDLSGWRTLPYRLAVAGCAPGGPWRAATVRVTPEAAVRPALEVALDCARDGALTTALPVGPAALTIVTHGGDRCGQATTRIAVLDGADAPPAEATVAVTEVPCAAVAGGAR